MAGGPRRSPNYEPRPDGTAIDMLVLHYTGMKSAEDAIGRLCDPTAKVSAHYVIDEDGTVHALVPETQRAWHAGISRWRGRPDVNSRSIGIELVNPGHEWGYRPFPLAQMNALAALSESILARHAIAPGDVVGHSDVAPSRKEDPGELFDWSWLAARGIGLWPSATSTEPVADAAAGLARLGYDDTQPMPVLLRAFQRRFRPNDFSGNPDAETLALIGSLLHLTGR